jgi:RNA polymerase sigma-70 factor (ECF subfamily)
LNRIEQQEEIQNNHLTDENFQQLIDGCMKNDRDAQYKLYRMFAGKMFAVCLRYVKDKATAEDLLQEGFVKVFSNIAQFRRTGSFEGWVRKIMVNTAIEYYRKNVKLYLLTNMEEEIMGMNVETIGDDLEVADIIKLIEQLSPGYRTVFNLHAIEGYTHKEIAKMLQISEGTSKSQLARARYLLMDMFEKNNGIKINRVAK